MVRVGEFGGRANEGWVAGVYGRDFTVGSLAGVGARDRRLEPGVKVSDEELTGWENGRT